MTKPTLTANAIQIPIKYLLKKYKKESGYKEAKKIYGASDVTKHDNFHCYASICWIIEEIVNNHEDRLPDGYHLINSVDVHAAFCEVAPFMFKSEHNNTGLIFDWLEKPFAEALAKGEKTDITITEQQIRIMKMMTLVTMDAVLNIKITPR